MTDRIIPPGTSRSRGRLGRAASALWGIAALVALGVAPAHASSTPQVTADPPTIAVGETTTVTATGLGGLETAYFGLDDTAAGRFTENNDTIYQAPVDNGTATATFSAAQAGTVTIAVGDGETPLTTVQLTITDGGGGGSVSVSASPASIAQGETTTVTATGLGGLETASFGLDDTSAGTFDGGGTSAQVPVSDGEASVTFTATKEGTVTVAVGDGETVLGTTTVTVTAASTPTPTPSPTASPEPTPAAGMHIGVLIAIIVIALLVIAGIITWIVLAQRRRTPSA